jgi:hypothetical protein
MITQKSPKSPKNYFCEKCDYTCYKTSEYNKHLMTRKHQNNDDELQKISKNLQKYSCDCGKNYKYRQGLYTHKKVCNKNLKNDITILDISDNSSNNEIKILSNLVLDVVNQNKELQKQIIDLCKDKNNTIIHNNIQNKTFNLQVFLNETCKDAMNIMDFVDSLTLKISDLENVGKVGYVDGISNIIVNNLKALDVSKRPLHCSDIKREILYVKDKNEWSKEKEKIKEVIQLIAHKNIQMIPEWKQQNPEHIYNEGKANDKYIQIVLQSMGGSDKIENEIFQDKIISKIAKTTIIEK